MAGFLAAESRRVERGVYASVTMRRLSLAIMDGTYKLFAAAVLGLALLFGSTKITDRIGARPAQAPVETAAKPASRPANAPQPVIIPAPNLPPPTVIQPDPASAPSASDYAADEPAAPPPAAAPAVSAEGTEPAPMIIIPAQQN